VSRLSKLRSKAQEAAQLALHGSALPELLQGRRLRQLRDQDGARRAFERAVELAPGLPRARLFLAKTYEALGRDTDALDQWAAAAALNPSSYTACYGEVDTLRRLGREADSQACLQSMLHRFADRERLHIDLGDIARGASDDAKAESHYRDAARLAQDSTAAELRIIELLHTSGRTDEARALAELVAPTHPTHRAQLAQLLHQLGGDALAHFGPLLAQTPQSVELGKLARAAWAQLGEEAGFAWMLEQLNWPARREALIASPALAGAPVPPQPVRLLFVSTGNEHFLDGLVAGLGADPRFEVAVVKLDGIAPTNRWWLTDVTDRVDRFQRFAAAQPETAAKLAWADIVFCEWCNAAAVWTSHLLPPGKRLVVRLHAYESFGPWPALVDWTRVDQLIFVADHIRDRVDDALRLSSFEHLKIHVLDPGHECARFHADKADAERTLGLVGYGRRVKRADLALQILADLQAHDPSWRLEMVGRPYEDEDWAAEVRARIEGLPNPSNVKLVEWTPQLERWFAGVGYVLSTSDREGTHEAVAQGMSSGAVPVVRRWPAAAAWRGADQRYPNALLFDEPMDAAEQILGAASRRGELGWRARTEAAERFDLRQIVSQLTLHLLEPGS